MVRLQDAEIALTVEKGAVEQCFCSYVLTSRVEKYKVTVLAGCLHSGATLGAEDSISERS